MEFTLGAKRDIPKAKRFFKKLMREGLVKRLGGGDVVGQVKFVESLFHVAAERTIRTGSS
jgi:hypothetical protein